jgi:DNA-binding GntR family transcriptional regulator
MHERAYGLIRQALMSGKYKPGERLTLRQLAKHLQMSEMPIREATRRLITEGAIEVPSTRVVQVPLMTKERLEELRDIRMELESLAVARALVRITDADVANLRRLHADISAARERHDVAADMSNIRAFHYALYALADLPDLTRILDSLWTLTGPYLNLLFPDYVESKAGPEIRVQLIKALEVHNAELARACIRFDIADALNYIIGLADKSGVIRAPRASNRRIKGG